MKSISIRYSNRTVTLIVLSPKYTNKRITKQTAQLQSNHEFQPESSLTIDSSAKVKSPCIWFTRACDNSARFKTTSRQFIQSKIILILEYSSARACNSSEKFQTISRHFIQSKIILIPECDLARAYGGSERFKTISRQFSWSKITLNTVQLQFVTVQKIQPESRHPVDSLARDKSPSRRFF